MLVNGEAFGERRFDKSFPVDIVAGDSTERNLPKQRISLGAPAQHPKVNSFQRRALSPIRKFRLHSSRHSETMEQVLVR